MRCAGLLFVAGLAANQSAWAQPGQLAIEITLKQGTAAEAQTREQLRRLLAAYVTPWSPW